MTEINLLPWRETMRHAVRKEFLLALAVIVFLGIFILAMVLNGIKTKIRHQERLNSELQQNIAVVNPKIGAIAAIKTELSHLSTKQDALEQLQLQGSVVAVLLEQMVYQIPSEMYLTRLDKKGSQFTLEGIAESNVHVYEFVQRIMGSKVMTKPDLSEVKAIDSHEQDKEYYFKITAQCLSLRDMNDVKQPNRIV